jgi:hypothetical protein
MSPIPISLPARVSLYACVAGMIGLGVFPGAALAMASEAVKALRF